MHQNSKKIKIQIKLDSKPQYYSSNSFASSTNAMKEPLVLVGLAIHDATTDSSFQRQFCFLLEIHSIFESRG